MIALLVAAQFMAGLPGAMTIAAPHGAPPVVIAPAPQRLGDASACPGAGKMETSVDPALLYRPEDRQRIWATTLNRLPKANYEIAVLRAVGGCPKPVIVRYQVGR